MLQGGNTSDKTLHKWKEDADDAPSQFHPKMNQEENKAFYVRTTPLKSLEDTMPSKDFIYFLVTSWKLRYCLISK